MSEHASLAGPEVGQFPTLTNWNEYVGQDWLYSYGSNEAHRHFRGKLEEEQAELREALAQGNVDDIVAEGGDVAWCATAIAFNAGITVDEAIDGSTIGGAGTPEDIDQLAANGLQYWDVPGVKAARNLSDAEVNKLMKAGDKEMLALVIAELSHQVCKSTEIYRKFLAEENTENNQWLYLHESRIKEGISELLVAVAIGARDANKTLSDVLQGTYAKLESRKASNRPITKLPRPLF